MTGTRIVSSAARSSAMQALLAAGLGIAVAWVVIGSPAFIAAGGMMADTDYANAAAAFSIFVRDGLRWPLGANPDFGGVNAFYSDIAPWFALSAKAFRALTGIALPFHSLIFVNFVLFSLMALRLMRLLTGSLLTVWLGTVLLAGNLMMPVRILGGQHIALGSFWVVLWAMACVPAMGEAASRARRYEFLCAVAFAIWSHAYIAAMAITIVLVFLLDARRWVSCALAILLPLLLLWVIGALDQPRLPLGGAKLYALDLAAFVASLGWGMTKQWYTIIDVQQGDTLVYAGTGACFGLAAGLIWAAARRLAPALPLEPAAGRRRLELCALSALMLAGFAMAFNLRVAGPVWIDLPIPSFFLPLYESFRAVGRFGSPLSCVLCVVAALCLGGLARANRLFAVAALAAAVLQLGDAVHAGLRPTAVARGKAAVQRSMVHALLDGSGWTGRVFRDVGYLELEDQRMIDYALVEAGARHFRVAHGARLDPEEVERRTGHSEAAQGDLVIGNTLPADLACSRAQRIKRYEFCLVGAPAQPQSAGSGG